jgi:hypothetical protein
VCDRVELLNQFAERGSTTNIIGEFARNVVLSARNVVHLERDHRGEWVQRLLAKQALLLVHLRVPYVSDPPSKDCYRDVQQTARNGGECKALNIFLVALLLRLGMTAEVYWINQPGRLLNHVASKVWIGGQPLWADGSVFGAQLGESPYQAIQRTGAWHVLGLSNAPRQRQ